MNFFFIIGKEETGNCVSLSAAFTEIAHDSPVNSICFSPNDALLATGSQDHSAKV
jgi:WD40 repeat protein